MKTFDIETFEKNKDALNNYTFVTGDSTLVKQSDDDYEYYETVTPKNPYFQTINRYYKDGTLKSTVQFFSNKFLKGLMKEYDEDGRLIKETDYDAPYKFDWGDVLKLVEERGIDMGTLQFQVNRNFSFGKQEQDESEPFWAITYEEKGFSDLKVLIIDGINGKVIKEYDENYPIEE